MDARKLYKDNKIVPTAVARLGQDIFSALVALANLSAYPSSKLSRWFTEVQKGYNASPVSLQILMNCITCIVLYGSLT